MTMHELGFRELRAGVQNTVAEDHRKTVLSWKAFHFKQTSKEHLMNNARDAEGLTKLTQETERRRHQHNEVEQDVEVAVREKHDTAQVEIATRSVYGA